MSAVSVVIPVRAGDSPDITLRSLARSTFEDYDIVVAHDQTGNANWARNRGYKNARAPLVLFSDADIEWLPDALDVLVGALQKHPEAAYAYGAYAIGNWVQCNLPFDELRLRRSNYISTMSLIRSDLFPGFDERLKRMQDWDLWLTMLEQGHRGVYCGRIVFSTEKGQGISYGSIGPSWEEAVEAVRQKHGLQ